MMDCMNAVERAGVLLILSVVLAGCTLMTPEERAALEEQERQRATACHQRGGLFVSGLCVSRGGGQ
jgi:hypothetical protein